MKVSYICGPCTGANTWETERNIRRAESLAFAVAEAGAMPCTPHSITRPFHGTLLRFWYDGTLELMRRCDALILVPGWEVSKGAGEEVAEAKRRSMPIFERVDELRTWLLVNSTPVKVRTAQEVAGEALADEDIYGCGDEPVSVGVQQRLVDAVTNAIELDRLTRPSRG